MPLYAGYLALFYYTGLSDPDFFEVAKRANIYLSLILLAALALLFYRYLPPLVATNLTCIVAFGYFIFKAPYAQSELLFYFLFFLTFLGCWHLLRGLDGLRAIVLAAATGGCAGMAHLTKAAVIPFVAIFLCVYAVGLLAAWQNRHPSRARSRYLRSGALAMLAFATTFLLVLWPYLSTSKRVFGQYLYNVNSTFYVWYDDWAHASLGTYSHGDGVGWPTMPASELPSAARYWREHSSRQILGRIGDGFADMAVKSVQMYEYLPYLLLYLAMFGAIVLTRGRILMGMIRANMLLIGFVLVYAAVYLVAIAFYYPTSGTGTARFFLAHLTPLFFALSFFFSRPQIADAAWKVGTLRFRLAHFHVLVSAILSLDVAFHLWPRLMSTYGGF